MMTKIWTTTTTKKSFLKKQIEENRLKDFLSTVYSKGKGKFSTERRPAFAVVEQEREKLDSWTYKFVEVRGE